jgi:hypothetical protein
MVAEATDGRYALIEFLFPKYASLPLHVNCGPPLGPDD